MNIEIVKDLLSLDQQTFSSFDDFKGSLIESGQFNIKHNDGTFEGLYLPKVGVNNKLFVCLSGARAASKNILPHVQRWKWNQRFKGSTLYVSDPSFRYNPNLSLGWYVGTKDHDWLVDLAHIIESFAEKQGLKSRDVILYGSSAGGFAAMKLASLIEGSVAVAINPQTNVMMYIPIFVKSFLKSNFDTDSLDFSDERLTVMTEEVKNTKSKIFLYQNINDESHYRNHYLPFVEYFNIDKTNQFDNANNIVAKLFDGPEGHGPEPGNKVEGLISLALALSEDSLEEANYIFKGL